MYKICIYISISLNTFMYTIYLSFSATLSLAVLSISLYIFLLTRDNPTDKTRALGQRIRLRINFDQRSRGRERLADTTGHKRINLLSTCAAAIHHFYEAMDITNLYMALKLKLVFQ